MAIIHLVEHSDLSITKTCAELDVACSTFYRWHYRYQEHGFEGLMDKRPKPRKFWNRIPAPVKDQIVTLALAHPDKSSRQIAWLFTDLHGYFVSESSVYRILKGFDLLQSPVFHMLPAREKFEKPTRRVHELRQTDFTQFKVFNHWGWYYLSTILDDYSRYIIAWRLSARMGADDVEETLKMALAETGLETARVCHRPRLLSDKGPAYLSRDLARFLKRKHMDHVRGAPYHPMTQGKIERWHCSMKNVVKLQNYYSPSDLEAAIEAFVEY